MKVEKKKKGLKRQRLADISMEHVYYMRGRKADVCQKSRSPEGFVLSVLREITALDTLAWSQQDVISP